MKTPDNLLWFFIALYTALLLFQFQFANEICSLFKKWIPVFRFFGPNGLKYDTCVAYQIIRNGNVHKRKLLVPSQHKVSHVFWNPGRRVGKSLEDAAQLMKRKSHLSNDPNNYCFFGSIRRWIVSDPIIKNGDSIFVCILIVYNLGQRNASSEDLATFWIDEHGCVK